MRTTTAYFAGVGTVAVALAAGLGGGLLFSNIVAPHEPKYAAEPTKLEQRMGARSIPVASAPVTSAASEPTPYLAATQPAAPPVVAAAPAPTEPQPAQPAAVASPAEQKTVSTTATAEPVASPPSAEPVARESATREPAASPREAFAKARDADIKRAATEKRRAERHQRWADKRRDRQPHEQELEAVEQSVRDATEPRQAFMAEPARLDTPRIRLFGDD
jgi:hypothetical protein